MHAEHEEDPRASRACKKDFKTVILACCRLLCAAKIMGLDGGTIISRSDVLRGASWELAQADDSRSTRGGSVPQGHLIKKRKLDKTVERRTKWTTCTLSGEPLTAPIVADYLGRLYSKAAILEFLLARQGAITEESQGYKFLNQLRLAGGAFDHITSTKDVFTVCLAGAQEGSAGTGPPQADGNDGNHAPYTCPITDLPCDRYPFCALTTCGHVFSERAVKEMQDGTCSLCSTPFRPADAIPINGSAEQVEQLKEALPQRRKAAGKRKKAINSAAPAAAKEGA